MWNHISGSSAIARIKTILAPIDFSPVTPSVITAAVSLAQAMNARLILLHVMPIPHSVATCQLGAGETADLLAATERGASQQLAGLIRDIAGIAVEPLTARGMAADEIVREARANGADYIVMGSHGHSALFEILVGSTTHNVMKWTACPILIVPARGSIAQETPQPPKNS
jgi:universal stress protein A